MTIINEQVNLTTPICLAEGDYSGLLHIEKMRNHGIPVVYNTKDLTLYTDNEANAEKARYLLFSCA